MRETEQTIEVETTTKEEVTLNQERIASYTVDKDRQEIRVRVVLFSDANSYVREENHFFYANEYVDQPTEEDLWRLVDKKRSDA